MATINLGAIKFNWKGAYNNSTTYAVDDVVSSGGNSYVCIQASQGNAVGNATAYWNIMSSAGTNGTNGTDLTSTLTTRGDIVYKGASALTRLPKGTSGYFLKQGANDPEWGAVDLTALSAASLTSGTIPNARYGTPTFSGANLTNLPVSADFVKLASITPSAVASISIDGYFSSTYKNYKLIFTNVCNLTSSYLYMRFNNGGSALTGSNYRGVQTYDYINSSGATGTNVQSNGWNSSSIRVTADMVANSANFGLCLEMNLYEPLNAGTGTYATWYHGAMYNGGASYLYAPKGMGNYANNHATSGVTLFFDTGSNFRAGGKIELYGIK